MKLTDKQKNMIIMVLCGALFIVSLLWGLSTQDAMNSCLQSHSEEICNYAIKR